MAKETTQRGLHHNIYCYVFMLWMQPANYIAGRPEQTVE